MHLGRLGDETYTTNSGIEVEQDSIYTAEGRIGTSVGYKFNDKGNIYADIEKSGASTVDTKWQGNLGFRYEF